MIRASLFLALTLLTSAANALLVNGDFQTGDLSGWTTFTTTNGTIGTPNVASFDVTGAGSSLSSIFNVGNISNPGNNGGGIFQSFNFGGGSLSVSADIASSRIGGPDNSDGGEFSLLIDGNLVDFFDFGPISGGSIERASLSGTVDGLLAGTHEFRILMTREYETSGNTPFQYIDNASADGRGTEPVNNVPTPGTITLLGLGLLGLALTRKNNVV